MAALSCYWWRLVCSGSARAREPRRSRRSRLSLRDVIASSLNALLTGCMDHLLPNGAAIHFFLPTKLVKLPLFFSGFVSPAMRHRAHGCRGFRGFSGCTFQGRACNVGGLFRLG